MTILDRFANYQSYINRSPKTIAEYRLNLTLFFRYLMARKSGLPTDDESLSRLDITAVDIDFLSKVSAEEIYAFLSYTNTDRGNKPAARARKLSAIRSLFKYLHVTLTAIADNPAKNIEAPRVKQSLPKHLSLEESVDLLDAVGGNEEDKNHVRDFAIVTLFLNCGIRLAELVGINLSDLDPHLEQMRVVGKGSKERIVYLNEACKEALRAYIAARPKSQREKNALFLSRLERQISRRTVQWLIEKHLREAGLEYKHYSTHKLRHTAATLMYQEGGVDVRVLKDILGHEQLNTTQIYTHVSNAQMKEAMEKNPLNLNKEKKEGDN